jgi:hypothetical protein
MALSSIRHDVGGPDGLLALRKTFDTHGAMRATGYAYESTGRMPNDWAEMYRADLRSPGISYVVFSYATPIAWVRTDGVTVIPEVAYSLTTTRHQNMCRAWLQG